MATRVSGAALGEIQKLLDWGAMGAWSDSQLIERFLGGPEESEAAFRMLIHRHGPMVLGICRRILGDEHAAEDAFQATFLVLVKKAGMLRDRDLLTNWLYGVATRVSHKERTRGARRRVVERRAAERATRVAAGPEPGDLRWLIDEEIRRLPERYRVPLLLCHVEGLRHDEVARRLGCPVGTVESRLSRAREQLRMRLARRGLAPTASAMAAALRPPGIGSVRTSLVESTLRAALSRPVLRLIPLAEAGTELGRGGRAAARVARGVGTATAGMVLCMGIAAAGLGVFRAEGPGPGPVPPSPAAAAVARTAVMPPAVVRAPSMSATPRRAPRAIAGPISAITVDGRLDDWPDGLPRYPIRNVLSGRTGTYRPEVRRDSLDLDAHFMVGYDPEAGLIYLAVVVRDDELDTRGTRRKGAGGEVFETDSVEVYVDGAFSDRKIREPWGDWRRELDASTMPVLQYVGVPAEVPAYGDPGGANPSLVYARTREPHTRMKYRRDEAAKSTTYEWAIRPYDRFPDVPTRLEPGKRIGLELAVVDRDSSRTKPAFVTWGAPPEVFKGCDAGSLGELLLTDRP